MLTGGEAHDCPAGAELVLQTERSEIVSRAVV
jgi:hypothetical protein